jgi:hypothetical protein
MNKVLSTILHIKEEDSSKASVAKELEVDDEGKNISELLKESEEKDDENPRGNE